MMAGVLYSRKLCLIILIIIISLSLAFYRRQPFWSFPQWKGNPKAASLKFILPHKNLYVTHFLYNRKKGCPSGQPFCSFTRKSAGRRSILNLDDLALVVGPAILADPVGHNQSSALAALYEVRRTHLPICSSGITSSFRRFILWTDWHVYTSFLLNINETADPLYISSNSFHF